MAAPPEAALSLLECRVCFERFGPAGPRRPQNLPCGHVLCSGCLCALRRPLCPFCRRPCGPAAAASDCRPLLQLLELCGPALRPRPCLRQCLGGWGALLNPAGLAACRASARLAVAHHGACRVAVFGPGGRCLRRFGPRDAVRYPLDVAIAAGGLLVVTDGGDRAVKAFDAEGRAVAAAREGLGLPWGLAATADGELVVSDAEAGALLRLSADLQRRRCLLGRLASPRAVAVCPRSGSLAVVEHLGAPGSAGGGGGTRVRVFGSDMRPLGQVDTFGLDIAFHARLRVSAVAFDGAGRVVVADAGGRAVICLGRPEEFPAFTPLVTHGLLHPVGLTYAADDSLVVLDGGDHSIKIYDSA